MKINVTINIDFLWGNKNFSKDEWGQITYVVGEVVSFFWTRRG